MPLPFFLAGLLGKAAAGAIAKGLAAKASAATAKAIVGHHAHRHLAHQIAGKLAEKLADFAVDSALFKRKLPHPQPRQIRSANQAHGLFRFGLVDSQIWHISWSSVEYLNRTSRRVAF